MECGLIVDMHSRMIRKICVSILWRVEKKRGCFKKPKSFSRFASETNGPISRPSHSSVPRSRFTRVIDASSKGGCSSRERCGGELDHRLSSLSPQIRYRVKSDRDSSISFFMIEWGCYRGLWWWWPIVSWSIAKSAIQPHRNACNLVNDAPFG